MKKLSLRLPTLHTSQLLIKREARRFNVIDCGRRFGKTTLGIDLAIDPALRGYPVGWFSPTYKNLLESWRSMVEILLPITASSNKQEHRIQLITGGVIEMWSLEKPQSIKGRKYKRAVLDEAATIKDLEQTWGYVIRPTLTDFLGDAWFFSTPQGRENYFYTLYMRGQKRDNDEEYNQLWKEWISWQMPTLSNPHIKPSEVEEAKKELPPHVFAQEYEALFIDAPGGLIFDTWSDNDSEPGNVTTEAEYIPGGGSIIWGADDGYSGSVDKQTGLPEATAHPRVILLAQLRFDGRLAVFAESWQVGTLHDKHIADLLETCKENDWPMPDYAATDSAAASLRGYLHEIGVSTLKASHPVEEGIKTSRVFLSADKNGVRNTIVHPRCKLLRQEMKRYTRTLDGVIVKQHDHACDALRYIHHTLRPR